MRLQSAVLLSVFVLSNFIGVASAQTGGNPLRGKSLFQERCSVCHAVSFDGSAQGPSLSSVIGRPSAAVPNFNYTKELRDAKLVWNETTLNKYLANPGALVPGTAMPIMVTDAQERSDLIAFLRTARGPAIQPATTNAVTSSAAPSDPEDWRSSQPGVKHRIALAQLPAPFASASARNPPRASEKPANVALAVPKGFEVKTFATELTGPRVVRIAPNGDIFVAETRAGRIKVLRAADGASQPASTEVFADGLTQPFGIAFYPAGANPEWIYIANINSVVRFPYKNGDLKARGAAQTIVAKLSDTTSGHTTRDIAFSKEGKRMFVSVGSSSNVGEGMSAKSEKEIRDWEKDRGVGAAWGVETNRAAVLTFTPDGKQERIFANGIRNCVGLSVNQANGDLWCATNERDLLGDNLVPDYVTRVKENGFYGWPWYYFGDHPDPRHQDSSRPDLVGKITVPDLPLQAHSAALQIVFYGAQSGPAAFPAEYRSDAFVALHGSWNRGLRTGYKVVRAFMKNGVPTGEYEDFLTGFVVDDSSVWGRPVGVAVAHDGALLISDDGSNTIWRVAYKKS